MLSLKEISSGAQERLMEFKQKYFENFAAIKTMVCGWLGITIAPIDEETDKKQVMEEELRDLQHGDVRRKVRPVPIIGFDIDIGTDRTNWFFWTTHLPTNRSPGPSARMTRIFSNF